jgi:hypothetical protein
MKIYINLFVLLFISLGYAQQDPKVFDIIDKTSSKEIKKDITKLVSFGTRNTFSDTTSTNRGIGAARRWLKSEYEAISKKCDACLEVFYQSGTVTAETSNRVPKKAEVVNVVAIQRGTKYPNSYIMMTGDIDSRASDTKDFTTDAPGANDNASGLAGTIEAARILSQYDFEHSIVYVGLSGEEQGLFGGQFLAEYAKENNWNIMGVINNDMIGNIKGSDGVIDNRSFRIFSEAYNPTETERERMMKRYYGGENDGNSRQLARYIHKITKSYMPEMNPRMVYRLDRFGRGGHHKPFNDLGYPGVRIMEAHENYVQQHQDVRKENGIQYGDMLKFVNFDYAEKLTAVNAISMANLAWAPPKPENVKIGGMVEGSVRLAWEAVHADDLRGYKIYWRKTTSSTWDNARFVGEKTKFTLDGIVIDNYLFGVASIDDKGHESVVVFPSEVMR